MTDPLNAKGVEAARSAIIGNPLNTEQIERMVRAYLAATPASTGEAVAARDAFAKLDAGLKLAAIGGPNTGPGSARRNLAKMLLPFLNPIEAALSAPPEVSALQAQIKALTEELDNALILIGDAALAVPGWRGEYLPEGIAALVSQAEAAEARATEAERQLAEGELVAPSVATNIAERILRQVRRTLAAEDKHARAPEGHMRDDVDVEYSILIGFSVEEVDAALAVVRRRRASPPPAREEGWQDAATAPKGEELFLAYCPPDPDFPEGRMIIVKGSILVSMMSAKTPNHLQFPATHWRPLPSPPTPSKRSGGNG